MASNPSGFPALYARPWQHPAGGPESLRISLLQEPGSRPISWADAVGEERNGSADYAGPLVEAAVLGACQDPLFN